MALIISEQIRLKSLHYNFLYFIDRRKLKITWLLFLFEIFFFYNELKEHVYF